MATISSPNDSKAVLIVAIDFGTTYSGASFAYSDDVNLQFLVESWPSKEGVVAGSDKVPTRVAYNNESRVSSWGFEIGETERRYQEFKLLLDKSRKVHHSSISQKFKDSAGLPFSPPFTATKLTIDFLRHLRTRIGEIVDIRFGKGTFEISSIEYVITVPAIWSDKAKDLTKFCAHNAGLLNAKLITEPEAAMVYVMQNMPTIDFSVGDTYMICDAGGGTVDLITYKVTSIEPHIEVEEVVQGNGDRCGSAFITRQFHQYILNNHARVVPSWTEEQTAAAVECFETKTKRKFDNDDMEVVVKVAGARDYQKDCIKVKKQKVFIPAADIKVMFDAVCCTVADLVKEQRCKAAQQSTSVTAIVLVGGFSESPYLRQYLKSEFTRIDKKITFVEPKHGWSAVVRGALSRALPIVASQQRFPRVTSRQARRFYGITQSRPFDASQDPESKKFLVKSDGTYWIECIFWFLGKGRAIKENYQNTRNYEHSWQSTSTDPRDSTIVLNIVSWDSSDDNAEPPCYPDAPGIEKVTNLNVDLSVIPKEDLIGKWKDNIMFYECYPNVRITYHFATIQYQLYIDEKCYGDSSGVTAQIRTIDYDIKELSSRWTKIHYSMVKEMRRTTRRLSRTGVATTGKGFS